MTSPSGSTPGSQVIAHDDLPPSAKEVFDESIDGASPQMDPVRDGDIIRVFQEYEYVEADGRLYRVTVEHDDGWGASTFSGHVWIGGSILLAAAAYQYLQAERRVDEST